MKFVNIKKLLIKFIGGGLINFPTRFIRQIKIDGDTENGDNENGKPWVDYFFYDDSEMAKPIAYAYCKYDETTGSNIPDVIIDSKDVTPEFISTHNLGIYGLYEESIDKYGIYFYYYNFPYYMPTRTEKTITINNKTYYYYTR